MPPWHGQLLCGHDRIAVWFKTTYAISAYHHQSCEFEPCSWRGVLDKTLCDKVCQWLVKGRLFSPGTPVSSINKTDRHDITEILLNHKPNQSGISESQMSTDLFVCCNHNPVFSSFMIHHRICYKCNRHVGVCHWNFGWHRVTTIQMKRKKRKNGYVNLPFLKRKTNHQVLNCNLLLLFCKK